MEAAQELTALDHGYLLIEPSNMPYAPFLKSITMTACIPRQLAHRAELMPQLIKLAEQDSQTQADLLSLWQKEVYAERPPLACAWIDSAVDVEPLSQSLAQHLVAHPQTEKIFWRYYDPRVLVMALATLSEKQRTALLHPAQTWLFPWAGHYWTVALPEQKAQPAAEQATIEPTAEQWQCINRSAIAGRILFRLPQLSQEAARVFPAKLNDLLAAITSARPSITPEELIDEAVSRQKDLI